MIRTLMQKTGLSDAEVCPSGPMPDKKLCKAMNFHYSTLAVYYLYHYLAVYYYYYFRTLAVYYAARNCGSFRSS